MDSPVTILFEQSPHSEQTTVIPEYSIIGFMERIGGGAVLLLFFCKTFVGSVERKMIEADLIRNFYQVEKDIQTQWKDEEERRKPPNIINRRGEIDYSPGQPKGGRPKITPADDKETLKALTDEWRNTLSFKQRVGRMVTRVDENNAVAEDDVKTLQQMILNRQNFNLWSTTWMLEHMRQLLCCCCKPSKSSKTDR